jgi:ERF superfamily
MNDQAKQQVVNITESMRVVSRELTPTDMLHQAVSQGASIEILEKLMALQERWERNQARKAFDEALSLAKAEIPTIVKNRQVGFEAKGSKVGYKHEDLAEIARTVDPILGKHGLSYRWRTTSEPNEPIAVTCIVTHRLGHFEENTLRAGRDDSGAKNAIQAIGSTLSYLQRYTLKAALGLAASNDDDGKAAAADDLVTADQVESLMKLITGIGTIDLPKFLKYLKVERLEDLRAKDYQRAMDAAESKRAKA